MTFRSDAQWCVCSPLKRGGVKLPDSTAQKKRNGKAVYEREFLELDDAGFGGVRPYLSRWDLS